MAASMSGSGLVALLSIGAIFIVGKCSINATTYREDFAVVTGLHVEDNPYTTPVTVNDDGTVSGGTSGTTHDRQVAGMYCDGREGGWSYNSDFGLGFWNHSTKTRHGNLVHATYMPLKIA